MIDSLLFAVFVFSVCLGMQAAVFKLGRFSGEDGWILSRVFALASLVFWSWIGFIFSLPNLVILAVPVALIVVGLLLPKNRASEKPPFWLNRIHGCVSAGVLVLLFGTESYSGGGWLGDWMEHFQRVQVFLYKNPVDYEFLSGLYHFSARPPGANTLAALFLGPFPTSFTNFQIVMTILGAEVLWAVYFFVSLFAKGKRLPFLIASLLCLLSPVFLENALFPWTKSIAALFVVSSVGCLYSFLISGKKSRVFLFGFFLAVGILVHYSAAVFLPGAGLVLVMHLIRKRKDLSSSGILAVLGPGALIGAIIIGSWILWASAQFGLSTTIGSTTTVSGSEEKGMIEFGGKILMNARNTIVPYYFRELDPFTQIVTHGRNPVVFSRDLLFNLFQTNFLFFGGFSAILLYPLLTLSKRFRLTDKIRFRECLILYSITFICGIAVLGAVDPIGVMHVCLQPLLYLSIAYLSLVFPRLCSFSKVFLSITLIATLVYGIGLHQYLLSWNPQEWLDLRHPIDPIQILIIDVSYAAFTNITIQVSEEILFVGSKFNLPFFIPFGIYLCVVAGFAWKVFKGIRTSPEETRVVPVD